MAREDYNACMTPWIRGKEGLDRRMSFCAGAKICSGKVKTLEEAQVLCNKAFAKKLGIRSQPLKIEIDDITVKLDGKTVIISPELFTELCGCKKK